MFEVGFQELVLIALLALIVLGPEKLPKLAAKIGHWTGRARSMARNLRQQLENEVSYDELMKQKQEAEEALRKATEAPMDFHAHVKREIDTALDPVEPTPTSTPGPTPESASSEAAPMPAAESPSPAHPESSTPKNLGTSA